MSAAFKPKRPQSATVPRRTSAVKFGNAAPLAKPKQAPTVFQEAPIPHPTMQSDPKQRMLEHPSQPAPVDEAASPRVETPRDKQRKPELAVARPPVPGNVDANHAQDVADLPFGWQKLESRKYPGMFYYLSPDGQRQWDAPHHSKEQKQVKKAKLKSIYQADYQLWNNLDQFNPQQLNSGTKTSASYALHPTAKKDPDWGISLKQKDHIRFEPEPAAPSTGMWPLPVVTPFGCNSSYRMDFQPQKPTRPSSARNRTPPRQLAFDHNSTNRADFIDHKPKRPVLVHAAPQLHHNESGPINSTSRADFVHHGQRVVANARRPKHFKDPGWVRNVKSTHHGTTAFAFSKDGAVTGTHKQYQIVDPLDDDTRSQRSSSTTARDRKPFCVTSAKPHHSFSHGIPQRPPSSSNVSAAAIEDLQRVLEEANEEQLQRGVPVVSGKRPGDFHSTYGDDFVDSEAVVDEQMRRRSKELDRLVIKRVKGHQDLRGGLLSN